MGIYIESLITNSIKKTIFKHLFTFLYFHERIYFNYDTKMLAMCRKKNKNPRESNGPAFLVHPGLEFSGGHLVNLDDVDNDTPT